MLEQRKTSRAQVLAIENLFISFPSAQGLATPVRGVTLRLDRGRTLALVGESGSGKTLTAMATLGLLPECTQVRGEVYLAGRPVHSLPEKDLVELRGRRVALIMQEPMAAMNPIMTVGRQVQEAVSLWNSTSPRNAREKVLELFREVGLGRPEEHSKAYPHELSGGQLQRVMIAMALARNPELLIADEPTTSLDVTIQRQILELLSVLQRERKMAMLFISHDIAVVAQIAHEVAVMYRGLIVEHGSMREILDNPRHSYTRTLLASHPEGAAHKSLLPVNAPKDIERLNMRQPCSPRSSSDRSQALAIRDLTVVYRKGLLSKRRVTALDKVSLFLNRGETLGLVGESGSGKSSLAKAVLGLAPVAGGCVEIFGNDPARVSPRERKALHRRCQIIRQNSTAALNPRLNVLCLLAEPFILHQGKTPADLKSRADMLLAEVGLTSEVLGRYPHQLSGGQRQRVNIARALASNPEVLICDEAISSLDISVQAKVLNLLLNIQKERGISILFISHDLLATHHISDHISVMKDGVVVEQGSAQQIFTNPKRRYTQKLIAACPRLHRREMDALEQKRAV
jgi:peptide/nickel transport system ATP-binding protein